RPAHAHHGRGDRPVFSPGRHGSDAGYSDERRGDQGMKHEHYFRDIPKGVKRMDIYRFLDLFDVTCPVAQHVIKKAVAAGQRGHKDLKRDWTDISDSAARKLEMIHEDTVIVELHNQHGAWDEGELRMQAIGPNGNDGLHYKDPFG